MWSEAAAELGGKCTTLGPDFAEIEIDGARTYVMHNVCAIDDPVTLAVLHDKPLTHQILESAGLPTPQHRVFSLGQMGPAEEFLQEIGGDCVVKPSGGTGGGRGVTTGIRTPWQLARAAAAAAIYHDQLLIERQIDGTNYRLLYLDGELIDSFARRPPTVEGDGKSSISRLVHLHNDNRLRHGAGVSQVLLSVDLDMRRTLEKQGFSLRSVPAAGTQIILKTVINENAGADNSTATHLFCRSIIDDGKRTVEALRARFAGIDLVSRDPSVPLAENGGVILEVNGTPNLYYHYHKSDGAFPAAVHVLRRLLLDSSGISRNMSWLDFTLDSTV